MMTWVVGDRPNVTPRKHCWPRPKVEVNNVFEGWHLVCRPPPTSSFIYLRNRYFLSLFVYRFRHGTRAKPAVDRRRRSGPVLPECHALIDKQTARGSIYSYSNMGIFTLKPDNIMFCQCELGLKMSRTEASELEGAVLFCVYICY